MMEEHIEAMLTKAGFRFERLQRENGALWGRVLALRAALMEIEFNAENNSDFTTEKAGEIATAALLKDDRVDA